MIVVNNIYKSFGSVNVLKGVDLHINKEEVANMHNNMVKVIEMGIENPELTLGEILSAI